PTPVMAPCCAKLRGTGVAGATDSGGGGSVAGSSVLDSGAGWVPADCDGTGPAGLVTRLCGSSTSASTTLSLCDPGAVPPASDPLRVPCPTSKSKSSSSSRGSSSEASTSGGSTASSSASGDSRWL